jgi:putative transposase
LRHARLDVSQQRACRVIKAVSPSVSYRSRSADNGDLRGKLPVRVQERRRLGYRRLNILLRCNWALINRKKKHLIFREKGQTARRRKGQNRRRESE